MRNNKLKRFFFTCCLLASISAFADVTIDGINYSLNISNKTAALSGSTLSDVVIPETITYDGITYTVTSIKHGAFYYKYTLKTMKLSSTVKIIEEDAFNRCSLQQIDLGSVETIENGAFSDCHNLNYIVLPKTIQTAKNIYRDHDSPYHYPHIICLREGFNTGASDYTTYPSSFYTISCSTHDYDGKNGPEVTYNFDGIGAGFQPTSEQLDAMDVKAGIHTGGLHEGGNRL